MSWKFKKLNHIYSKCVSKSINPYIYVSLGPRHIVLHGKILPASNDAKHLSLVVAHIVKTVSSVRVGNIYFIYMQFSAFSFAASLGVQLKLDYLKVMKVSLLSKIKKEF